MFKINNIDMAGKPTVEQRATQTKYEGIVNNNFKVGNKTYEIGDKYITKDKFTYDTLKQQKRIK